MRDGRLAMLAAIAALGPRIFVDATPRAQVPPPMPDRPSRWPVENKIHAQLPHQGKREIARRLKRIQKGKSP